MAGTFLNALQQAPALLSSCKTAGVLRQLRAVNKVARELAISGITTATVYLGNTLQLAALLRMMQHCQLTKVVLVASTIRAPPMGSWYRFAKAAEDGECFDTRYALI